MGASTGFGRGKILVGLETTGLGATGGAAAKAALTLKEFGIAVACEGGSGGCILLWDDAGVSFVATVGGPGITCCVG